MTTKDVFVTHTGEKVTGERLENARIIVANWCVKHAEYMRFGCPDYADHVTEDDKEKDYQERLVHAEEVKNGKCPSFDTWQRVNYELTGECIGFLGNG